MVSFSIVTGSEKHKRRKAQLLAGDPVRLPNGNGVVNIKGAVADALIGTKSVICKKGKGFYNG